MKIDIIKTTNDIKNICKHFGIKVYVDNRYMELKVIIYFLNKFPRRRVLKKIQLCKEYILEHMSVGILCIFKSKKEFKKEIKRRK